MMQIDAHNQYFVGEAAQDLIKTARQMNGPKRQIKVEVVLTVGGKKYDYTVSTPVLEGDIKVTGHEVESDGIKL